MTDMEFTDQKKLLEAALFMASEPMGTDKLSKIVGIHSLGILESTLVELQEEYLDRGFELVNTTEGWQFQVKAKFLNKVAKLTPYSDIPEGWKRCLALIAYKEPIYQAEIIRMQGNKAYSYIKHLEKKGLIKTEKEGRTKVLKLTQEFERYFGDKKEKIRERLIKKFNRDEKEI